MIEKIKPQAVELLGVQALPTTPSAQGTAGGYSPTEIKAAFDRLTVHVIEKYNLLVDAIHSSGADSILAEIPSGIRDGHTAAELIEDIKSGNISSYLKVADRSLCEEIAMLRERITRLEERI